MPFSEVGFGYGYTPGKEQFPPRVQRLLWRMLCLCFMMINLLYTLIKPTGDPSSLFTMSTWWAP